MPFLAVVPVSSAHGPCDHRGERVPKFCESLTTTSTVTSTSTVTVTTTTTQTKTGTVTTTQTTTATLTTTHSSSETSSTTESTTTQASTSSSLGGQALPQTQIIVNVNATMPFSGLQYIFPVTNVYGITTSTFYEAITAQYVYPPGSYAGYYLRSFSPISGCQQGVRDNVTVAINEKTLTQSVVCPAPGKVAFINFTI